MVSNIKKKRKNNKKNKQKKKQGNTQFKNLIEESNEPTETGEVEDGMEPLGEPQGSRKRQLQADEDSEHDDEKPRKKKKKKQVAPEGADKKGKKSIRQTKREKHLERLAAAQAASKDQLKAQCISYLSQWKHDRSNWKFMKAKQVWLYKNKFSSYLVPDSSWPVFIEYFQNAQGNIRTMLLDDAKKVIQQIDEWTEAQKDRNKGNDESEKTEDETEEQDTNKPDETSCKRARDLIQNISE